MISKIGISSISFVVILIITLIRFSAKNQENGLGWIKESPFHFVSMVIIVVVYMAFMLFSLLRDRKK